MLNLILGIVSITGALGTINKDNNIIVRYLYNSYKNYKNSKNYINEESLSSTMNRRETSEETLGGDSVYENLNKSYLKKVHKIKIS